MSRQFVGPIRARFDVALPATAVVLYRSYLFVFDVLDLFISTCTLKSTILLECSDISFRLIWVPIMYVVIMTYIWIGLSWIFFLYN